MYTHLGVVLPKDILFSKTSRQHNTHIPAVCTLYTFYILMQLRIRQTLHTEYMSALKYPWVNHPGNFFETITTAVVSGYYWILFWDMNSWFSPNFSKKKFWKWMFRTSNAEIFMLWFFRLFSNCQAPNITSILFYKNVLKGASKQ